MFQQGMPGFLEKERTVNGQVNAADKTLHRGRGEINQGREIGDKCYRL